jgi:restriction endonuclease S subunit
MTDYYFRFPNVLEGRIDFVYYHPRFDRIVNLKDDYKYPVHSLGEYIVRSWTGENLGTRDIKEKKYLYVKVENVLDNEIIVTDNSEFLSNSELEQLSGSIPKPNSILVTRVASFGRCAVVSSDFKGAISDNILCFELDDRVVPQFVSRFVNSQLAQMQLERQAAGMGRGVLTYDRIGNLLVGVPPSKDEQNEILKKVEATELETATLEKEVLKLLSDAQMLFLDMIGISAPHELNRTSYYGGYATTANRLDFDYNNPRYDIVNEIISRSPIFVDLNEAAILVQDSKNPTVNPKTNFSYVDIGNVDTIWGRLNPITLMGKDAKSSRMRRVMYADTVLVSTTRPTRNAIGLVPSELDGQICSTGFAVLKCKKGMDNRFLFHALRSRLVNWELERNCSGSGYPAINQEVDLPRIRVPKPLIDKQLGIVKEVEKLWKSAELKQREIIQREIGLADYFDNLLLHQGQKD